MVAKTLTVYIVSLGNQINIQVKFYWLLKRRKPSCRALPAPKILLISFPTITVSSRYLITYNVTNEGYIRKKIKDRVSHYF